MMSSLYIGATGLKSHGEGMAVVTHNLANANTVGYKQQSMQYMDLVSQFMTAGSNLLTNLSQKGSGSAPGSVRTLFEGGGYEPGSTATDMSIQGKGFFGVTRDGETHYTRAGNFRFQESGELQDPSGWTVLGHQFTNGQEAPRTSPVVLTPEMAFMQGQASGNLVATAMLGGLENKSNDPANPFFGMAASWNPGANPPLAQGDYSYSQPVEFYDANGDPQRATLYYDLAGENGGNTVVEYVLAMDPALDASGRAGTGVAGLLMAGTLTFASNGELSNLTAFTPPASGPASDLSAWSAAPLSENGHPLFSVQTEGAAAQNISLNMGLALPDNAGLASAADAAADPAAVYAKNPAATLDAVSASTFYGESCASLITTKDGYGKGSLTDVNVTSDGLMQGVYTNGETVDLYRISLYRFTSQDGLQREGENHFSATQESGAAQEGVAGTENFGPIAEFSIETSNVDYAREFSLMIVTQRGYQMNSKVVSTSDEMLRKALEIKR